MNQKCSNIAFDKLGPVHHLPGDGMIRKKVPDFFTKRCIVIGPITAPLIDHDSDARVTPLELDPPGPPTITQNVICRGATDANIVFGKLGVFLR
jgi:hypothetical protein